MRQVRRSLAAARNQQRQQQQLAPQRVQCRRVTLSRLDWRHLSPVAGSRDSQVATASRQPQPLSVLTRPSFAPIDSLALVRCCRSLGRSSRSPAGANSTASDARRAARGSGRHGISRADSRRSCWRPCCCCRCRCLGSSQASRDGWPRRRSGSLASARARLARLGFV